MAMAIINRGALDNTPGRAEKIQGVGNKYTCNWGDYHDTILHDIATQTIEYVRLP